MVLTDTGAKLSKSLIREGKVALPPGTHDWMLDVTGWPGSIDDYVDALVWLVGRMLADPKHFYRSYATAELGRLMTARPAATTTGMRAREINLYRRYFDLVTAGRKTIEVRVQYPNLRELAAGDHIRFVCGRDDALTVVKRSPAIAPSRKCWTVRVPRKSTPAVLATSNWPTSAASTARRRSPWASWPSRSSSCAQQPR